MEKEQKYYHEGVWTFQRIGKNIWKIYITKSPHSITMKGSDVTTELHIPFIHRWLRIHFFHTDSSYDAVTGGDRLNILLKRTAGTLTPQKFEEYLYKETGLTSARITEVFGESFEYESGIHQLVLNSTSTNLVFPVFYIQKLEG